MSTPMSNSFLKFLASRQNGSVTLKAPLAPPGVEWPRNAVGFAHQALHHVGLFKHQQSVNQLEGNLLTISAQLEAALVKCDGQAATIAAASAMVDKLTSEVQRLNEEQAIAVKKGDLLLVEKEILRLGLLDAHSKILETEASRDEFERHAIQFREDGLELSYKVSELEVAQLDVAIQLADAIGALDMEKAAHQATIDVCKALEEDKGHLIAELEHTRVRLEAVIKQLQESQDELAEQEALAATHKANAEALETENNALTDQLATKDEQILALVDANTELQRRLSDLGTTALATNDAAAIDNSADDEGDFDLDITRLELEINNDLLMESNNTLKAEIDMIRKALVAAEVKNATAEDEIERLKAIIHQQAMHTTSLTQQLQGERVFHKSALDKVTRQNDVLRDEILRAKAVNKHLSSDLQLTLAVATKAEEAVKEKDLTLEAERQENANLQEKVRALSQELSVVNRPLETSKKAIQDAYLAKVQKLDRLQKDHSLLQDENNYLKMEIVGLESRIDSVKSSGSGSRYGSLKASKVRSSTPLKDKKQFASENTPVGSPVPSVSVPLPPFQVLHSASRLG
ncbi:hypothetical protein K474DRAFT_1432531 [Panus rudis PR-1116 ss-1]|nr:hypothetical protein K474DRAFT_1432531 [Panus rudis PR-1116 ss-1]